MVVWVLRLFPKTVMMEERAGSNFVSHAFSVQQSRLGYGTVVRLWVADSKGSTLRDVRLNLPRLRLSVLKQHTWLAKNRALLLALEMEVDLGSYTQLDERWVLYNFKTGDLKTCSSWEQTSCEDVQASAKTLEER
jgi:hypothetical protein